MDRGSASVKALAGILTAGALVACSSTPSPPPSAPLSALRTAADSTAADSAAPRAAERSERLHRLAADRSRSTGPASRSAYLIGPDDLLRVDVFGAPDLSGERRVSPQGEIAVPLVGPVEVAGLSPRELEGRLEEELSEEYMKDPHVTVQVTEMKSHGVSVVGAVEEPGLYQLSGSTTLLEVLARAQGLAENAASTVLVIRNGSASDGGSARRVAIDELLNGGDLTLNVPIRAGDVVKVPEAGLVYVTGQVEEPGGFPVRRGSDMTAVQALSLAGGLTDRADAGSAWIIRVDENDRRRDIPVNLGDVLEKDVPDPKLRAGDVLYVPKSATKTLFGGLWEAVLRIVTLGTIGL